MFIAPRIAKKNIASRKWPSPLPRGEKSFGAVTDYKHLVPTGRNAELLRIAKSQACPTRYVRAREAKPGLRLRGPHPKLTDEALQTLENLRHLYIGQREGHLSIAAVSSS